jgi:hypothetical protein
VANLITGGESVSVASKMSVETTSTTASASSGGGGLLGLSALVSKKKESTHPNMYKTQKLTRISDSIDENLL